MSLAERSLVYDVTHLVSRLSIEAPTGIDRVDLMYGLHFAGAQSKIAAAIHYGLKRPHVLTPARAQTIVQSSQILWHTDRPLVSDSRFQALAQWLREDRKDLPAATRITPAPSSFWRRFLRSSRISRLRLTHDFRQDIPHRAIYLNVAQHAFEFPRYFNWLETRPDLSTVFFVHDLMPLDCPEFFRDNYRERFDRRVQTIARHASALIVSSAAVADRVSEELKARSRLAVPIHVAPLPSPVSPSDERHASALADTPYFLVIGTIEPRKNHLLLLHLWRELAKHPVTVPRLVIVGARGWENEQAIDMLERSQAIAPYVIEVSGLSTPAVRQLIIDARAVLMPSFNEGYGLPIVEALALGTPVIASDIPIFREISQGCALLLDPLDGPGWLAAIQAMAAAQSNLRTKWVEAASGYRRPSWTKYFSGVESFLRSL